MAGSLEAFLAKPFLWGSVCPVSPLFYNRSTTDILMRYATYGMPVAVAPCPTSGGTSPVTLAGTLVLGPRLGKYTKNGRIKPILGHNMPLAALGVFILWLGWFGFNPGSTLGVGNGDLIARVAINTNLAAAAGGIAAMALIAQNRNTNTIAAPKCGLPRSKKMSK